MRNLLRRKHGRVITRSRETAELAAQLVPPEEKKNGQAEATNGAPHNAGSIVVDTGELKLPPGINEEKRGAKLFDVDPVVACIFIFAVIFIAFISYLIATGPTG